MKRLFLTALVSLGFSAVANPVQAFGPFGACCLPPCSPCVTYVDRVVTCYRPVWQEEKVKCVVNKVYCKVEDASYKCVVPVPRWEDVKKTITYSVPVPRIVEREVVCCRLVSVPCQDPCTGCTYNCLRPETYTKKVKVTVYDCRLETKDIMVKVCRMEPQVREVKHKRFIPYCQPETVEFVRRYCVMRPYQTTVKVPVWGPCGSMSYAP